jgi:hypothetical protein
MGIGANLDHIACPAPSQINGIHALWILHLHFEVTVWFEIGNRMMKEQDSIVTFVRPQFGHIRFVPNFVLKDFEKDIETEGATQFFFGNDRTSRIQN